MRFFGAPLSARSHSTASAKLPGAASIHEDEAVVLVIRTAVFVVLQLEVALLKLHSIRRERTIVGHFVDDGIDDAAFANEMPLAGELFPAEPHAKYHR